MTKKASASFRASFPSTTNESWPMSAESIFLSRFGPSGLVCGFFFLLGVSGSGLNWIYLLDFDIQRLESVGYVLNTTRYGFFFSTARSLLHLLVILSSRTYPLALPRVCRELFFSQQQTYPLSCDGDCIGSSS